MENFPEARKSNLETCDFIPLESLRGRAKTRGWVKQERLSCTYSVGRTTRKSTWRRAEARGEQSHWMAHLCLVLFFFFNREVHGPKLKTQTTPHIDNTAV